MIAVDQTRSPVCFPFSESPCIRPAVRRDRRTLLAIVRRTATTTATGTHSSTILRQGSLSISTTIAPVRLDLVGENKGGIVRVVLIHAHAVVGLAALVRCRSRLHDSSASGLIRTRRTPRGLGPGELYSRGGSFTTVRQNSVMALMTRWNSFKSGGLVMYELAWRS